MNLEFKRLCYNVAALADLGQQVTSVEDYDRRIRSVLHVITGTFLVSKGVIFTYLADRSVLSPIVQKGFAGLPRTLKVSPEKLSVAQNEPLLLENTDGAFFNPPVRRRLLAARVRIFVPLWSRDILMGALALGGKFTEAPYTKEDMEVLRAVSGQLAITLHHHNLFRDLADKLEENTRLYEEMRRIYHDTIQALAAAIDAKDAYTKNHSYRVAKYVVAIARELDWEENDIEGLYVAGLLHDVGKIILNIDLLNKERPLTDQEIMEIKKHPDFSYDIISKIKFPWKNVVDVVRHHHERVDGRGYPDALGDTSLSEGAKILTLADAFDAMTTDRPYRRRMDLIAALDELRRCNGSQFDAHIISAFCRVLEKEIQGDLPDPQILPHLEEDFDPTVITTMLQAIRQELTV